MTCPYFKYNVNGIHYTKFINYMYKFIKLLLLLFCVYKFINLISYKLLYRKIDLSNFASVLFFLQISY